MTGVFSLGTHSLEVALCPSRHLKDEDVHRDDFPCGVRLRKNLSRAIWDCGFLCFQRISYRQGRVTREHRPQWIKVCRSEGSHFCSDCLLSTPSPCVLDYQAGLVIASPSTTNPNYLFTWVRDSSLVFKVLIDQFTTGVDTSLRTLIDEFVIAESALQSVTNPSGSIVTGGLGEPKFNIDGSAFTEPWGRPQRGELIRSR